MTGCPALRSQIEGVASPLHDARHVVANAPEFSPLGWSLRTQSSPRATTRSGLVTAFQPRRPPQPDSRWRGGHPVGSSRLRRTSIRFRNGPTTFPTVPITGVVALSEPAPQWFGPVPSPYHARLDIHDWVALGDPPPTDAQTVSLVRQQPRLVRRFHERRHSISRYPAPGKVGRFRAGVFPSATFLTSPVVPMEPTTS